ncbi:MAG: hypothetical protein KDC38_00280 [Planctomycetes bacterium]|nr:hypothetical protein [Planctomycetota bacterium]
MFERPKHRESCATVAMAMLRPAVLLLALGSGSAVHADPSPGGAALGNREPVDLSWLERHPADPLRLGGRVGWEEWCDGAGSILGLGSETNWIGTDFFDWVGTHVPGLQLTPDDRGVWSVAGDAETLARWTRCRNALRSHFDGRYRIEVVERSGDGKVATRVVRTVRRGERARLDAVQERPQLGDYEVNQTGPLPIAVPTIETIPHGLAVEVTLRPYPEPDVVRVDFALRRTSVDTERFELGGTFSAIDLPSIDAAFVRSSADLPLDGAFHRIVTRDDRTVELRATRLAPADASLIDTSALIGILERETADAVPSSPRRPRRGSSPFGVDDPDLEIVPPTYGSKHAARGVVTGLDPIDGLVDATRWESLTETDRRHWSEAERSQRQIRTIELVWLKSDQIDPAELESILGARDGVPESELPTGVHWTAQRVTVEARAGEPCFLRSGCDRSFVHRVETVSGGSTSVIGESDPVVSGFGTGFEVRVRFETSDDGTLQLEASASWAEVSSVEVREVTYPVLRTSPNDLSKLSYREIETMNLQFPHTIQRFAELRQSVPPNHIEWLSIDCAPELGTVLLGVVIRAPGPPTRN